MTPAEYQQLALRTEFTPTFINVEGNTQEENHRLSRIMHAVMGLCTESSEAIDMLDKHDQGAMFDGVNLIEETGDLQWYLALLHDALGDVVTEVEFLDEGLLPIAAVRHAVMAMSACAGEAMDLLKKKLLYGRAFDDLTLLNKAITLHQHGMVLMRLMNTTLEDCRERNIAKLAKRYGEKFSAERALNRDLSAERKILEG